MLRMSRFAACTFWLVVAGCATTPDPQTHARSRTPMPVSCEAGGTCSVPVTIEHWPTQCFFVCELITPNEVIVKDANKRWNQAIVWEIPADSHVRFADDGIVFERDAGFVCELEKGGGDAGRRFTCTDNGKQGRSKYSVHLQWGLLSFRIDPFVVNR